MSCMDALFTHAVVLIIFSNPNSNPDANNSRLAPYITSFSTLSSLSSRSRHGMKGMAFGTCVERQCCYYSSRKRALPKKGEDSLTIMEHVRDVALQV